MSPFDNFFVRPRPAASFLCLALFTSGLTMSVQAQTTGELKLVNVAAENVVYRGVSAVRLTQSLDSSQAHFNTLAIVAAGNFGDGVIELDLAGALQPNAPDPGSGFLGVAFHIQPQTAAYEMFYLRPSNARAPDQLRRNHVTQYVSFPDWSWERTRRETPGLYESYADLEVGAWTKVRIVVAGRKAELYLNGAAQPALIVNDLKLGPTKGAIGLWVGSGGEAYFANLRVKPER
jgi:hypothetical protein